MFYEPSVGVPLIVRVPGLTPAGERSRTPVSLVQVLPTLLDLCGVPVPGGLDGDSFVPDLRDPKRTRDTTVYSEYNLRNARAKYMIRRGDFKYNFYKSDTPELYDLRRDPKEVNNLVDVKQYAPKVAEMKAQLFAWHNPA